MIRFKVGRQVLLTLAIPALSWAGPTSSGGGMAVVCRNSDGLIQSAKVLDFYEAEVRDASSILKSAGSLQADYSQLVQSTYALQGYDISNTDTTQTNLNKFLERIRWVSAPDTLSFTGDQGASAAPPTGCQLEQLAVFHDEDESIRIDSEIWNKLDSMNQAVLVIHELFYHQERKFGETTSESTRAYTRQVLTPSSYSPVKSGVETAKLACSLSDPKNNSVSEFYLHRTPDRKGLVLQFTFLGGRPLLVKTTVDVPKKWFAGNMEFLDNHLAFVANDHESFEGIVGVNTEHRKDWKLQIKWIHGEVVTFGLLQNGKMISNMMISSCSPVQ